MPNFRGVIFDLDGTLVDSLEDLGDCMNTVLKTFGLPQHPMNSYKNFVGDGLRIFVERALPRGAAQEAIEICLDAMRKEYELGWARKTRLYPGISGLLDSLSRRQVKMGILSNKPDEFTQKMVKKLLAPWNFGAVSGESPRFPKKPHPAAAMQMMKDLDVAPEEGVFVGDSPIDVKTAKAAGFTAMGVLWGFRPEHELRIAGADWLIAIPGDLEKFF